MKRGFVFLPVLIVVAVFVVGSAGFFYYKNSEKNASNNAKTEDVSPAASPTSGPTETPTFTPTPSPKPTPTKKPATPTPKPTAAETGCSKFKPENGLTSVTINLKEKDGKALAGDWIVKIKPTGSCPGILPPNWGGELNEVVRQPNYTYTSPGMHPGQFRVDIQYHYSGEGFDWDGTSGNHSREITVSN